MQASVLRFSPQDFLQPFFKFLENQKEKCRPLPTKFCAWLRGQRIRKLPVVDVRHRQGQNPSATYLFIREKEWEIGEENKTTTDLFVKHRKLKDEVCYRRSPHGGLGESFTSKVGTA